MLPQTFFIIKPDAVQRNLSGKILSLIEENGFTVTNLSMLTPQLSLIEAHYSEHNGKNFYKSLIGSMYTHTPIIVGTLTMKKKPKHVFPAFRKFMGHYQEPTAGTIRHLYMIDSMKNSIHGSADEIAARKEIDLWYKWF